MKKSGAVIGTAMFLADSFVDISSGPFLRSTCVKNQCQSRSPRVGCSG